METIARIVSENAKSPLQVIGLFITLVYAISGWVLARTLVELDIALQFILIGFIVLYPIILLFIFYALVTCHADKLYSPHDFRTDEGFHTYAGLKKEKPQQLISDYDPSVSKKMETEKTGSAPSTTSVVSILGKSRLAAELAKKYFEQKYGADNVIAEALDSRARWDLKIRLNTRDRLYVEIKLLSSKSPIGRIAGHMYQQSELVEHMNYHGTRERSFLFYAVIDGTEEERASIELKFKRLMQENGYQFPCEFVTLEALQMKYFGVFA